MDLLPRLAFQIFAFVGNTWQEILWDLLPLLLFSITCIVFARKGGRLTTGRKRFVSGSLLLSLALLLDVTDEFLGLNLVPLIGRLSAWHEGAETMLFVTGFALFLSAVNSWIRYNE